MVATQIFFYLLIRTLGFEFLQFDNLAHLFHRGWFNHQPPTTNFRKNIFQPNFYRGGSKAPRFPLGSWQTFLLGRSHLDRGSWPRPRGGSPRLGPQRSHRIVQGSNPGLGGGNSKILYFHPRKLGEDEPILTDIFQGGWFNHQLVEVKHLFFGWWGAPLL